MRVTSTPIFILALAALASASGASASCNEASLNTTTGTYVVQTGDTIFTIAKAFNRGVCDIARANRMADAELITVGEELLIPGQVCEPDNDSCLLTAQNATRDCIFGGPHTYQTAPGDTIETIALKKLNITVESLLSLATVHGRDVNASAVLPSGTTLKIPQCSPSRCVVEPYEFVYGTYADLARRFHTTVGQLFAFNPTYNKSTADPGTGPIITVPVNCTALAENVTAIS